MIFCHFIYKAPIRVPIMVYRWIELRSNIAVDTKKVVNLETLFLASLLHG